MYIADSRICLVFIMKCFTQEMFIHELTKECYKLCDAKAKAVEYKQLAEYVQGQNKLEFLHQILPKKITVREFRKIVENLPDPDDSSADSSSSSSTSSSSEEEEVKEKEKPKQVRPKKAATVKTPNTSTTNEIIEIDD